MTMTSDEASRSIVFYDISHRPPVTETCCAPNPWKARLALNFKGVPYSTSWVQMPNIAKVRTGLKISACRTFADGTDFNTLPIIQDPNTNSTVGDSFEIAVHLQKTYPASSGAGNLFPPQTLDFTFGGGPRELLIPLSKPSEGEYGEYASFNTNVDTAFTAHTALMVHGLPLDPDTAELTKAEFVRRAGVSGWDDFLLIGEAREKLKRSFEDTLSGLAELFERDGTGPFVMGQQATYADFIVGGWLRMMCVTLPEREWEEARNWHGGVFGRLHDALDRYAEVK